MNQSTGFIPCHSRAPMRLQRAGLPVAEPKIGQILVASGDLSPGDLIKAIALQSREEAMIGEIMLGNGMVSDIALAKALARQFNCRLFDPNQDQPDIRFIREIRPEICLRLGLLPLLHVGGVTMVATNHPERFARAKKDFPASFGSAAMVIATEPDLRRALLKVAEHPLAEHAEIRVACQDSCRNWNAETMARLAASLLLMLVAGFLVSPANTLLFLTSWAVLALLFNTGLKCAAAISNLRATRCHQINFTSQRPKPTVSKLPKVSIIVPLFREPEIASRLLRRLKRLTYPRELLDICLVMEAGDHETLAAIQRTKLPSWVQSIQVPHGQLKTKPRALNYALDFCKGSIVGILDAEDAPEPDQIFKVARRFRESGPEVACLQGVLDFYSARQNWLSRCFTIEYATWFRMVLPGLERLGLVIPLGGTTVYFRKAVLEEIGGWDAHNVTEDADLGVRLARKGYRTELLPTLTEEEPNCHIWPWIRQRSRWLKGYAITWAVHMRDPKKLLSDIGPWRFFGVQLVFLSTLSQFVLAPLLWSFWVLPFGVSHPLQASLSSASIYLFAALFLLSELVTIVVGIASLSPTRHRGLWVWVPTLHFYFPLATIAAYKGIWELVSKPFYWDKTTHGREASVFRPSKLRSAFSPRYWRRRL